MKHVTDMVVSLAQLAALVLCTPFGWVGLFVLYAIVHGLK